MTKDPPNSGSRPPLVYEASGLKKEYDDGRVPALRGVDFQIAEGEFVSIIGPSGCGKTTLLNMLGALDQPTAGEIRYRGTHIPDLPDPSDYRAKEIGFIFQSFHLLPTFTVEENVQIPMFGLSGGKRERRARARELVEAVGLAHRLNHLPVKLSGGERQRAAIARSLANDPGVLLADEPTGNLDSKNAAQVTDLLCELQAERGKTMVLVTHDLEVANRASRTIRFKDGLVVNADGSSASPTI